MPNILGGMNMKRYIVVVCLTLAIIFISGCAGIGTKVTPVNDPDNSQAQGMLKEAVSTAIKYGNEHTNWNTMNAAIMKKAMPDFTFVDGNEPGVGQISVAGADDYFILKIKSKGGTTFVAFCNTNNTVDYSQY